MQAALALCWPLRPLRDNENNQKELSRTVIDKSPYDATYANDAQERMKTFTTRLYPALFDPDLHFDAVYPTRSSPLRQTLNMRRALALKSNIMSDDQAFMGSKELTKEAEDVKRLDAEADDTVAAPEGQTLFIEDY